MEKCAYNNLDSYSGMDINSSPYNSDIIEDIGISTEYVQFKLFTLANIVNTLVKESNNFMMNILIDKYEKHYEDNILDKKNYKIYPYLFIKKAIHKKDIYAFIGISIFMEMYKFPCIGNYWENNNVYKYYIPKIMSKEYYDKIRNALHFEEKDKNEIKYDDENTSKVNEDLRNQGIKLNYLRKIKSKF